MLREFSKTHSRVLLVAAFMLFWLTSHAQTSQVNATCTNPPAQSSLLSEVHTIADPSRGVPVECSFDVAVAGTYQVKLSDLGVVPGSSPAVAAPLASVTLALTSGSTVVGTPLKASGSLQFAATVGTYVIHVAGLPGTQLGSGPIGIQVTNVSDNSILASFSSTIALPGTVLPSNVSTLDGSFTVPSAGNYVVTLTDLQLPRALSIVTLVLTTASGTFVTNPPLTAAGSVTVPLQTGVTYRIFAAGQADSTANAGLFGASVIPAGGGTPAYSKAVPVGGVVALNSNPLNAGTSYTLKLADLAAPAPLASLGAVVTTNGQAVAQLAAAGSAPAFTATAGTYQVFAAAATSTTGTNTTGSYSISLTPASGPPVLSAARAVSAPGGTGPVAYSFDATVATAGAYAFNLADFALPTSFASITALVFQNGAVLGTPLSVPGTQSVNLTAGPATVLVFAQPSSGGSLLGVDLTPTGTGATPIFTATQGVGQLFTARQVSITTAGNYAVHVSDVGFPAALATFAVIVTRGSAHFGSIYGGGAFAFPAQPGNYLINFIAKPSGSDQAGTYSLDVGVAPSVKLQSDATTVPSGDAVHLTWSSQNATSCTASGGWSGSQPTQGTATSAALTATTTFTLTCSGQGTTDVQSVTVNVTSPPAAHSGGGALDIGILVLLCGLVLGRSYIRHAR
jgi:hypothetical protein